MNARILDGIACSKTIRAEIAARARLLPRKPGLAVILVGDDPASAIYVRNKAKAAREAGFESMIETIPATATQAEVLRAVERLNADPSVDGYIVQLPLPGHLDAGAVIAAIDPAKDADGLHPVNQGRLMRGDPLFVPATPRGILELLERNGCTTAGKHVVILGRSAIVGKPLAMALLAKSPMGNATVTVAHSMTQGLAALCRIADILVAAIGRPGFVGADFIKDGAVVVDVGINRNGGEIRGDVRFEEAAKAASAITPVPGGIGPMTIAMLLLNALEAAERRLAR